MPILEDEDGIPVACFGFGDIAMLEGKASDNLPCNGMILLGSPDLHEVGEVVTPCPYNGKTTDELLAEGFKMVRLVFWNPLSLQALIDSLNELKESMNAQSEDFWQFEREVRLRSLESKF